MAIVRLEFDLDSDVYPELHRSLAALRSPEARAERLRQLAAAGLVWENVRLYGAGAIGPTPPAQVPAAGRPVPAAPTEAKAAPAPRGEPHRPKAARTRPPPDKPAKKDPRWAGDFVDLAIDAEPEADALGRALPSPMPERPASAPVPRISQRDLDQVARELPVLRDVVGPDEVVAAEPASPSDPAFVPPLYVVPSAAAVSAQASSAASVGDGAHEPALAVAVADDGIPVRSLSHKPAARSRLMRMKERGLFKNG